MATALVGDPELLFLDEPTTGLDPQARRHLWDLVEGFKAAGRTIILTTHYMDEAEQLCDRVAIMDHGKVIALGTPQELISTVGGEDIVEFAVSDSQVSEARPGAPSIVVDSAMLTAIPGVQSHRVNGALHQLSVTELHTSVPRIFAALAGQGLHLSEFRTTPPRLKTSSCASPGGTCAMNSLENSSLFQLTLVRFRLVLREAGSHLLDLSFSHSAGHRAGHRLPQPPCRRAARCRNNAAAHPGADLRFRFESDDNGRG